MIGVCADLGCQRIGFRGLLSFGNREYWLFISDSEEIVSHPPSQSPSPARDR